MIQEILTGLASVTKLPVPILAITAGTLMAWGVTQRFKFMLPLRWSAKAREIATQASAFVTGFVTTFVLFPYSNFPASLFAALIVGLWSPALWNVLTFLLGLKWPEMVAKLSQANRGGT